MSTLEVVREMLFQAPDTPPGDVLKSAQEELRRLSDLVQNAKNVLQCNGARKKLAELRPLLPALEITVGLSRLEGALAKDKSAGERAAARVQAQKLAGQIAGLEADEERDFFRHWLAELNLPPVSISPSSNTAERDARAGLDVPAIPVAPAAPALPPDPVAEIQGALAELETAIKTKPIADAARLTRQVEGLARRIEALPSGEVHAKLLGRSDAVITALKFDEQLRNLSEAIGALELSSTQPAGDLSTLSSERDRLGSRIASLGSGPWTDVLKKRLAGVDASLAVRRAAGEIEQGLQRCAERIQKSPRDKSIEEELSLLADQIALLPDTSMRSAFSQRVATIRATAGSRREEGKISQALEELKQKCRAPGTTPLRSLSSACTKIASEVQGLAAGPARVDLEKQLRECRDLIAGLEAKPARKALPPASVLQLDPIKGRSAPSARPLVFVARDRFSIGRKPENEPPRADLLTPSSELRISRVHVTMFARQRQIHVLAGEEGKPSTNPALIDQTPLSTTPVAMSFENERRIDLTGVFTLQAKLMPSSTPFGPPFDADSKGGNNNATVVVPSIAGALRIRPQGEDRLPVAAVWLFTDATIGSNAECAITLPQSGMAAEQARIHFWKRSFWLEVLRPGSLVQLGGKSLNPGVSEPLVSGQELRLGNFIYKVQLS